MAAKSSFGIDKAVLESLDFELANKRINSDVKSDFILAPHLSCIYTDAVDQLVSDVKAQLSSGAFSPQLPLTIDVPKKQRIAHFGVKRQPPNFTRPGAILLPHDRLLLQVLADNAQPVVEAKLDRTSCYSHQVADDLRTERMFKSSRECWGQMQAKLRSLVLPGYPVVLRVDIAACFQSINQHTLVNMLEASGLTKGLVNPLEAMLTQMTISRSSRGILQGIFPSDLFGNFYLYPIDRFFSDNKIPVVRYVDDIYAFFASNEQCDRYTLALYKELRKLDLHLNEAKSCVTTPLGLLTSDPDLDRLFESAVAEIEERSKDFSEEEIYTDYGFQTIWREEIEELTEAELELLATEHLFDQTAKYPSNIEEIERFCLPIFARFGSDYALEHVLSLVENNSSLSQIYFNYLSNFLHLEKVQQKICQIIKGRKLLFEWEYQWAIACLIQLESLDDSTVADLISLAKEPLHESVVALALIAAAKHGDYDRQKTVSDAAQSINSLYVRGAILFGARYMHKALRKNTLDVLENQNPLFRLIATSVRKH